MARPTMETVAGIRPDVGLNESVLAAQQETLAGQVGGVANALRGTVNQLNEQDQAAVAYYADRAAAGLERLSITLRDNDLPTIVHKAKDFAREKPGVFIGGAVAVGFLLSRFLGDAAQPPKAGAPENPAG